MAQHRFTDRWLQSPSLTPPSGRAEYVDGLCPGLHLRVTVMGTRTFSAMYWVNGQLRRKTIGKYPVVTLAAARSTALKLMRDAQDNREMIPETEALRRQKLLNLSNDPVRYYLYERLTDGINITVKGADMASPIYLWHESETVWVAVADLAEDYRAFTEANGLQYNVRSFQLQLRNYMPDGFESKVRRGREGDTITGSYRAYPIPPLEEARATFEAKTGLKIDRDPVEGEDIGRD